MNKIKLQTKSIQYSNSQSGAYVIILDDIEKTRRLPIVIGGFEARAIAFVLEDIAPTRPLTHDLFKSFSDEYSINLKEIVICKFQEGIFYSKMVFEQSGEEKEVDARTSDAIALALRFKAPIYVYEDIIEETGIELDEDLDKDLDDIDDTNEPENELERYNLMELENILKEAIEEEDYERASQIRDEINRRERNS